MAYIEINHEKVTPEIAEKLVSICPFGAISQDSGKLRIDSGCKMCRRCLKADEDGVLSFVDDTPKTQIDKDSWRGIAVFAEYTGNKIHPVTFELLGKAQQLASAERAGGLPVFAVLPGWQTAGASKELSFYGAQTIYVYDGKPLEHFDPQRYAACVSDFIQKVKPSVLMVGATSLGRSLAPRIAARFRTGLTADCTGLELRENSDLVQTRPAFGGNIMAQIVTPRTRPQLCTVRYRVFDPAVRREKPTAEIVNMPLPQGLESMGAFISEVIPKAKELDISEAEVIVAVGRGVKDKAGLKLAETLAEKLGAQLACTRPMVENGWFDPRRQIGLSGRTVKPKLIVTVGVSGAVQFTAGMNQADCIVAINQNPHAAIFDTAHVGLAGDLYEILPALIQKIEKESRPLC
jgi:electron transfer flavoprotein alpha subunit